MTTYRRKLIQYSVYQKPIIKGIIDVNRYNLNIGILALFLALIVQNSIKALNLDQFDLLSFKYKWIKQNSKISSLQKKKIHYSFASHSTQERASSPSPTLNSQSTSTASSPNRISLFSSSQQNGYIFTDLVQYKQVFHSNPESLLRGSELIVEETLNNLCGIRQK